MRSRRLSRIREEAVRALRELGEELGAEVYLFGSYAEGTHTLESDVDVVVVSERFEGLSYAERVRLVRERLPERLGFDVIALTPREFEERKGRAFFRSISRRWVRVA